MTYTYVLHYYSFVLILCFHTYLYNFLQLTLAFFIPRGLFGFFFYRSDLMKVNIYDFDLYKFNLYFYNIDSTQVICDIDQVESDEVIYELNQVECD